MPTQPIYSGKLFEVRAWVKRDLCQVLEFLKELARNGNTDAERLFNLFITTADNGPTGNIKHVRYLGEDIYEFKAPNTARICFFYDTGLKSFIICTHGFVGKKGSEKKFIQGQIEKAVRIKNEYFGEKG